MSELFSFFDMGGYAWYVWPSFGLTFVVLLANVLISNSQFRKVKKQIILRARKQVQS